MRPGKAHLPEQRAIAPFWPRCNSSLSFRASSSHRLRYRLHSYLVSFRNRRTHRLCSAVLMTHCMCPKPTLPRSSLACRKPFCRCEFSLQCSTPVHRSLTSIYRPDRGDAVILVGEGEYHETINVTRKGPLTLLVSLRLVFVVFGFDNPTYRDN